MFAEFLSYIVGKLVFFCASIGGDSFPKPLSKEEERRCLIAFKNGDMQAKEKLIKHNLRLVAHIVKKYQGAYDNEDLISVGTIGLVKAINSYDYTKGAQLTTYTARCIENEILMYIRKHSGERAEVSFDEPLNTDWDGNELLLSDILSSDEDRISFEIEQNEERARVRRAVFSLGSREREIIELRFGLNGKQELTQKEVADKLGISQSYISRLEKKIIARLKVEIESR